MDVQTKKNGPFDDVAGIVLAAGKGTRMHCQGPKVLQTLLGKPMLWYVLNALARVCRSCFAVVGHGSEQVEAEFSKWEGGFVFQKKQQGTGHAVSVALPRIQARGFSYFLVLNGDAPLVTGELLTEFVRRGLESGAGVSVLTMEPTDPGAYGRIVRLPDGSVERIVEASDIDDPELAGVKEVNSGIYLFRTEIAAQLMDFLDADNSQNEYYLTQSVELARRFGAKVQAVSFGNRPELLGINTVSELCSQEDALRAKIVSAFLDKGVIIRNPQTVTLGPEIHLEAGVEICGPARITGKTRISGYSQVEGNTVISDSRIHGARVRAFSHLELVEVSAGAEIGPYARLRPGTFIGENARVGNFVEAKKAVFGPGSKVNHLSYIGDCDLGRDVNVGAGTITCNYDGRDKHRTVVGDEAFIGSNTALVAPVSVGPGALIGAGSTITRDVPGDALAVARAKQKNLERKK
ncbi:MAG: bifunctional UDP-N-acetylglucosamine diphosphorylase/glucosamine-1-phosphate N-acetyltransferase GlmU [Desulfonatronovibrionaceae bacterium]